jgi:glycosyltransferase involved in cell wall biosynthesis
MTAPSGSKPKIMHVNLDYHTWGGIEQYLYSLLTCLKNNDQFEVLHFGTTGSPILEKLNEAGIKTYGSIFPFKKRSLIRSICCKPMGRTLNLSFYKTLLDVLKKEKPDLVHVHGGRLELACIKKAGFPIIYTYHGYGGVYNIEASPNPVERFYYKLISPLLKNLTPYLDGMLVVSKYEQERLYREGFLPKGFPTEVLYNGMSITALQEHSSKEAKLAFRRVLKLAPEARVASFFCRLANDKNAGAFLTIAEKVIQHPNLKVPVHFLVAGDGKLAPLFKAAFAEGGKLSGYGTYLGFRSDVPQLLNASDLTLCPSLQEGFGLRVLESIAMGRPCLSYATGAIPEVMDLPEAQPWLTPVGDEQALADAIVATLNQPESYFEAMQERLMTYAVRFDLPKQVDAVAAYYTKKLSELASTKN